MGTTRHPAAPWCRARRCRGRRAPRDQHLLPVAQLRREVDGVRIAGARGASGPAQRVADACPRVERVDAGPPDGARDVDERPRPGCALQRRSGGPRRAGEVAGAAVAAQQADPEDQDDAAMLA